MKERITKNEERLDNIQDSIQLLEFALNNFKKCKRDLYLLNKYYGSKVWFKDKDDYEKNKIPHIKAGVLSEDAIWDTNENIKELLEDMQSIIELYK